MAVVKCVDKDNIITPCRLATDPKPIGILSTKDMRFLGYSSCMITGKTYLFNADRICGDYSPSLK